MSFRPLIAVIAIALASFACGTAKVAPPVAPASQAVVLPLALPPAPPVTLSGEPVAPQTAPAASEDDGRLSPLDYKKPLGFEKQPLAGSVINLKRPSDGAKIVVDAYDDMEPAQVILLDTKGYVENGCVPLTEVVQNPNTEFFAVVVACEDGIVAALFAGSIAGRTYGIQGLWPKEAAVDKASSQIIFDFVASLRAKQIV